jgi:hypothetical protein
MPTLIAHWAREKDPSTEQPTSIQWSDSSPATIHDFFRHCTDTYDFEDTADGPVQRIYPEIVADVRYDAAAGTWFVTGHGIETVSLDLANYDASDHDITASLHDLPRLYRAVIHRGSSSDSDTIVGTPFPVKFETEESTLGIGKKKFGFPIARITPNDVISYCTKHWQNPTVEDAASWLSENRSKFEGAMRNALERDLHTILDDMTTDSSPVPAVNGELASLDALIFTASDTRTGEPDTGSMTKIEPRLEWSIRISTFLSFGSRHLSAWSSSEL